MVVTHLGYGNVINAFARRRHPTYTFRYRFCESCRFGLTDQQTQGSRKPPVLPWPDISSRAKWSVSSFKFGFGAECLLDGDPDTFWQ